MLRDIPFSWRDFFDTWVMAYKKGYEDGYSDKAKDVGYRPSSFSHPPDVLRKIFESVKEQEEE